MTDQEEIVIALDGSEPAYAALMEARKMAQAMNRKLSALYVFPHNPGVSTTLAGLEDVGQARKRIEKAGKSKSSALFDEAESRIGTSLANRHLLVGKPAEEIVAFMESNPNVHLVMGRRGLSKIKALIMGSVSAKVVAYAPGLVTVV